MPIGILRRLRLDCLCFSSKQSSDVSMPIGILRRLRLGPFDGIVMGLDGFNAHRHSPSIATPKLEGDPCRSITFQCPSAFSVDCDLGAVHGQPGQHIVSMPIGILRRLRLSPRRPRTRWRNRFQCPSAFSVDCDVAAHRPPQNTEECFNAHRHSPSIATVVNAM